GGQGSRLQSGTGRRGTLPALRPPRSPGVRAMRMITLPEPASDLVQNRAQRTLLPCVLAGVFTLLWCGLILLGVTETRARADEQNYHLPAVLHFAEQLPLPDLSDYPSATTPGYHLLLSLAAKGAGFAGWTDGEGLERLL